MIVSAAVLGCLIGAAIAGTLSDRFGRKPILLLSAAMFVAAVAGCTFPVGPYAVQYLILARFVVGAGIGVTSTLSPLYIAEIAPARLRGRLISMYQWAISIGALCVFLSNYCVWLPLIFVVYMACFNFSLAPAVWVVISEIFPTKVRGRAMSIATLSLWTSCTVVAMTLAMLGPTFTFWLYASTIPVAMIFVWFLVPETKGQSLEQIEKRWMH